MDYMYCPKAVGNIRCRKQGRDCISVWYVVCLDSRHLAYVYKLAVMPIVMDCTRNAQNCCRGSLFLFCLTVLHGSCFVAYRTISDGLIRLCRSAFWHRLCRLSISIQSCTCTSQLAKFCHFAVAVLRCL